MSISMLKVLPSPEQEEGQEIDVKEYLAGQIESAIRSYHEMGGELDDVELSQILTERIDKMSELEHAWAKSELEKGKTILMWIAPKPKQCSPDEAVSTLRREMGIVQNLLTPGSPHNLPNGIMEAGIDGMLGIDDESSEGVDAFLSSYPPDEAYGKSAEDLRSNPRIHGDWKVSIDAASLSPRQNFWRMHRLLSEVIKTTSGYEWYIAKLVTAIAVEEGVSSACHYAQDPRKHNGREVLVSGVDPSGKFYVRWQNIKKRQNKGVGTVRLKPEQQGDALDSFLRKHVGHGSDW